MSSGLLGLFDDVAALAKLAAASVDDVGAAAGRASVKAAGVVVDDTAVTPAYVHGLAAERELPIIKRIAKGSLKNKMLFILPAALVLSEFVPMLVEIILMIGGTYLCFEGAEKIHHRLAHHDDGGATRAAGHRARPGAGGADHRGCDPHRLHPLRRDHGDRAQGGPRRGVRVAGDHPRGRRRADHRRRVRRRGADREDGRRRPADGESARPAAQRIGRGLVAGMPKLLAVLSVVGTAAMVWVGGHILLAGRTSSAGTGPTTSSTTSRTRCTTSPASAACSAGSLTPASAVVGLAVGALAVGRRAREGPARRVLRCRRDRGTTAHRPTAGAARSPRDRE